MLVFNVSKIAEAQPAHDWSDYVMGVARELALAGYTIEPRNLLIYSTVPVGSGLSSSAAIEVSVALALLGGRPIEPLELAKLCRRAENNFVGMPCGIMDQYISVFGREHSAVEIDCRSLERRYVQFPTAVSFVAVNTMVKHSLGSSAYRDRVAECAAATEGGHLALVASDVTLLYALKKAGVEEGSLFGRKTGKIMSRPRRSSYLDHRVAGEPIQ